MTNPIETGVGDDERRRIRLNELDAVDRELFEILDRRYAISGGMEDSITTVLAALRQFIQSRRDRA